MMKRLKRIKVETRIHLSDLEFSKTVGAAGPRRPVLPQSEPPTNKEIR